MQPQILHDFHGLSQVLRSRRRALGLTQDELGQRSGVSAKHVSRIENGTHEPRISTVFALFAALGLDCTLGLRGQVLTPPDITEIF